MSTQLIRKYADIVTESDFFKNPDLLAQDQLSAPPEEINIDEAEFDGPGMLDQPDLSEIHEYLEALESHLWEAIDKARYLARLGRNVSGPFSGQLKSYLMPHLEAWIEDTNQPGSLASLRRMLEDE